MNFVTQLPEADYSVRDLQDRLAFYAHLTKGLKDAEEGRVHPHEEVMQDLDRWLSE